MKLRQRRSRRVTGVVAFLLWLPVMTSSSGFAGIEPVTLRVDGMSTPVGVDTDQPALGWHVAAPAGTRGAIQTAYQILVASTPQLLAEDRGDVWDSGRVESPRSLGIAYTGRKLRPAERVYWKVRLWDTSTDAPAWSEARSWTMGLLSPTDWAPAKWIGLGPADAKKQPGSVLLRKEFVVKPGLSRAVVFATGLAQFDMSLNGKKVGDRRLSPGWSEFRKTVLYETFDITEQVRSGANGIGITLGHGMYHIEPTTGRYVKFIKSFGPLKAIAQVRLDYLDGGSEIVATDGSWSASTGPITYSNVFGGEDYDARLAAPGWDAAGFAPTTPWIGATEMEGPGGVLRGEGASAPPIVTIEKRTPVSSRELRPGVTVYDFGQNASFMIGFTARGPRGSVVRVIPSELLGKDGAVDRQSCVQDKGGPAWWQLTLAGDGSEVFVPRFFYQGCRYLQVELVTAEAGGALPVVESIEGLIVHSSAAPIGRFECSNTLFNQIYALVRWAQRSNMMSLMTDCPQREKLGWLEELHLNGPSLRYNFALEKLFTKQMNDMADAQLANGLVPNIAPEYFLAHTDKLTDPFRNSVEWGSSFVIVPWQQYLFSGDVALLRRYVVPMARYVDFVSGMAKDHIVSHGLGDWYDLGPKPPWGSQLTPPPFTATAIYYYDLTVMASIHDVLGDPTQAAVYRDRAAQVRTAFNAKFFDPATKKYATGSQCTSAMPLVLGLVEDQHRAAVLQALIDDIRSRGNGLTAGDVGYRYVLRALADAGRSDVVFDMNNQTERPGYGMQIKKGATALTEKWDASVGNFGSQNHFMLGQINEWLFHDLAGIRPDPAGAGFDKIVIQPAVVGDIQWVKCAYDSPRGTIDVAWRLTGDRFALDVTIPANTVATVVLPSQTSRGVYEGGKPVKEVRGIRPIGDDGLRFEVGSGVYHFESR